MRETDEQPVAGGAASTEGLETSIGYRFTDRRYLDEALTHRSWLNEVRSPTVPDNERLEFFGDAILGFCIGKMLLRHYPESREGALARMKSALVGEETLADLAAAVELGSYLRLGRGEERSGGRHRRSLLANALEALLAAMYLDGGMAPVERLVEAWFGPRLAGVAAGIKGRDFKTDFQELAQAQYGGLPRYILVDTSGPAHDLRFTVAAYVGECLLGQGTGRSKKEAEQAAARQCLERLEAGRCSAAP
ncbi:ribonuclease III [Geobacter sulfurreducens]|uniref:ribonuclease III n=1 Tax=Geobacter sulfurreducens TaxID=35554 RepID=UPI000DBB1503|nr:ribonuclease III [Geobacter sulfurreducens]BBA70678.1 Ribonuclease 3 [Geobacter sulfurreducens]